MLSTPLRFQLGKSIQSSSGIQRPDSGSSRYAPPISVRAYTSPGCVVLKTIPVMKPPPPPMTTLLKLYGVYPCADTGEALNGAMSIAASTGTRIALPNLENEQAEMLLLNIILLSMGSMREPRQQGRRRCTPKHC